MNKLKVASRLCFLLMLFSLNACRKEADMSLMQSNMLENSVIQGLNVDDQWSVTVVQSDGDNHVELEYSAYLKDDIEVSMDGDVLNVGLKSSAVYYHETILKAVVYAKSIDRITISDESRVDLKGVFVSDSIHVELSDASVLTADTILATKASLNLKDKSNVGPFCFIGTTCLADLSEASNLLANIEAAQNMEVSLKNQSKFVNFSGKTETVSLSMSDASNANFVRTEVSQMNVEMQTNSTATVWVTDVLSGSVADASTLYYKGSPTIDLEISDDSEVILL